MTCECSGSGAPTTFNGQRGQIVHLLDAEEVKSTAPSHAHSTLRGKSSLEELSLGATSSPWGEENVLNGTDGLTGTVVVASVPLGLSSGSIGLDILQAGADDLEELELPVWVGSEGLNEALLVVILVIDELVLRVVVAGLGVNNGLWGELLDGGLNVRPVVVLELLDEGVSVVSHSLVWGEARVNHGARINTEGSVEDTSLEIGGSGSWDSSVLSANWCVHPWGEDELLEVADSLARAIVVTGVPLGGGVLDVSLDVCHAGADDLEDLELPVGVSSEGLDDGLLVVPLVIDVLVGWVVVADISVSLDLRDEFLDSSSDSGPVLVLKGGNESIGVVGQVLIWLEARVDIGTDIDTEGSVEDTGLEICDGSGGDSAVLGKNESFSNNGEHFHGQESLKIIYYYNSDESNRRHMWQLARIAYIIL